MSVYVGNKPLQRVSYKEKIKNDFQFCKNNIDFFISRSCFGDITYKRQQTLRTLYEAVNNVFPESWFSHVTDPLSATDENHKNFPGKIRPANILRTNIDLLRGELPKRPYPYQIMNVSGDATNTFLEARNKVVGDNIKQHYANAIAAELTKQGIPPDQLDAQVQQVPPPGVVLTEFNATYKDKLAIIAERELEKAKEKLRITEVYDQMFYHHLVAGESYSFKDVRHNQLVYEPVSPMDIDYEKSPDKEYVEDASWVVRNMWLTPSDVVDMFYDELDSKDLDNIDKGYMSSPQGFFEFMSTSVDTTTAGDPRSQSHMRNYVRVQHVVWKGQTKVGVYKGNDPITGEPFEEEVSEDFPMSLVDKENGETLDWYWVNEMWEGYRAHGTVYFKMRAIPIQRNDVSNLSECKGPYNGRVYSNMHASPMSIAELGMPYQILYIIAFRALELTIAKSKGKILMMDVNAIPKKKGWNEEKFFYYAEAMGFGLLDRNQIGVDKSYNQYQVLDMGLYDQMKNLIDLCNFFKQEYDEVLGINRSRKGESYASDSVTNQQQSLFQSSVITDMIFRRFEQLLRSDLQGLIDYSKFTNLEGKGALYNGDDNKTIYEQIDPIQYSNASFEIMVSDSSKESDKLNRVRQIAATLAQGDMDPMAIVEVQLADNVSKLKAVLKTIQNDKMQASQAQDKSQSDMEKEQNEIKFEYEKLLKGLDTDFMNAEYDRKEHLESLRGDYSTAEAGMRNQNDADVMNQTNTELARIHEIEQTQKTNAENKKHAVMQNQIASENTRQDKELAFKKQELGVKKQIEDKKAANKPAPARPK